ncbi:T9SS type A sorting domain-containing protein [Flavobacterium caeni]|uniref:Delta-60 repeat domain-containing protein/Por secretion system C-terminal sorting domain-containing protein n=1 Tax=Flavobacterium caeni TaxID=490189 RepID=A0A1G5AMF5_9FLAO|nr:T9SS type A sorting domain-containing protein [Flavobacterium caeni]SCX79010.1 delta-60 repeat domain-containing protein/Por secretion system C-terminal sorting domain-containing protein [Flavobacterium caeni]
MKRIGVFLGALSFFGTQINAQTLFSDTMFGQNGLVSCSFGTQNHNLRRVAIQPDGKIVACGEYIFRAPGSVQNTVEIALSRVHPDGSFDHSFGVDGKKRIPFLANEEMSPVAVKILDNGKILLLCYKRYEPNVFLTHTALVRLHPDGSPDASFGINGILDIDPAASSMATGLEIQPDGKILVGGYTGSLQVHDLAVYRLHPDGTPDLTFGANGLFSINWGRDTNPFEETYDEIDVLKLAPDGSIFAAGDVTQTEPDAQPTSKFVVVKLTPDGALDTSFGSDGRVMTQFADDGTGHILRSLEIGANQTVTITGMTTSANDYYYGVATARYLSDGTPDAAYGNQGVTFFDNGMTYPKFAVFNSVAREDGKLLMVGVGNNQDTPLSGGQSTTHSILLQLNHDGTVDESFASNGLYWPVLPGINNEVATWDFAVQPDGELVIGGRYKDIDNKNKIGLWRLQSTALGSKSFVQGGFSATPNPFVDHIDIRSGWGRNMSAELFDLSGRKVAAISQSVALDGETLRLPVESLPKGTYLLRISDENQQYVFKMVK